MTLLPVEPVRTGIPEIPPCFVLRVSATCAAPGCGAEARQGHHVVRRSATGGPLDVVLIDGAPVVNRIGLCDDCHDMLTGLVGGHRAALVMPPLDRIEAGLYRRWWVWFAATRPAVPGLSLPPRVLKTGRVLWPSDYVKEVSSE